MRSAIELNPARPLPLYRTNIAMRLITILAAGLAAVVCADRSQFGTPMRPFADDMSYDAGLGSSSPNGPLHARGCMSSTLYSVY